MLPRSLKVAIAGVRSLALDRRRPNPVLRELMSTHEGDQGVRRGPDLRQVPATEQRIANELDLLFERNGVVS